MATLLEFLSKTKLAIKYKNAEKNYKVFQGLTKASKGAVGVILNPAGTAMHGTMDAMWIPGAFTSGFFEGIRPSVFIKGLRESHKAGGIKEMKKFRNEYLETWNPFSIGALSTITKTAGFLTGAGTKAAGIGFKLGAPYLDAAGGKIFRGTVSAVEYTAKQVPGAINLIGGSSLEAIRMVNSASESKLGRFALGWGSLAGFGVYGVLGQAREDNLPEASPYITNPYATPGLEDDPRFAPRLVDKTKKKNNTLSKTALMMTDDVAIAASRSYAVDSLGATGDLVFALHNNR